MNQFAEIINKFQSTLPVIRNWIDNLLEDNKQNASPVINNRFAKLEQIFPTDLLQKSKVVTVKDKVPFPPLSSIGLHELAGMENMNMLGITYMDTIFINQAYSSESLHFHELVHVVQWDRLGPDNFLLAYGIGLMQFGYRDSPFEKVAYSLQSSFDNDALPPMIINLIQQRTDEIWNGVAPLLT
jgi:hypothetical protein